MKALMQHYLTEHRIRELIGSRGMRPAKAIRRVLGPLCDDDLHALVRLWRDGEFSVELSGTLEVFKKAYSEVRSCMQYQGAMVHRAYTPNGIILAVARRQDGTISARALIRPEHKTFNKVYGRSAYALDVFLRVVLDYEFSEDWLDDIAPQIRHDYWVTETELRWIDGRYSGVHSLVDEQSIELRPDNYVDIVPARDRPGYVWARPWIPGHHIERKVSRKKTFVPYLDTIKSPRYAHN